MKIVHQGRGGYIECDGLHFDIELMAGEPAFAIHFPRRKHDKKLAKIRKEIDALVAANPKKWEVSDYDSEHGFYGGMTVNERLVVAGVFDDFEKAIRSSNDRLAKEILMDVDLSVENADAIIKAAKKA